MAFTVGKWGHEGMRGLYEYPAFIVYDYHWAPNPAFYDDSIERDDRGTTVSPADS